MASQEEAPAVIWEAVFARSRELVRALLMPDGAQSAEPSADAVADKEEKGLVASMARLNPAVTREDVDALAFTVTVSELIRTVRRRGRSLNAPNNVMEEAVTHAVADGVAYTDGFEAGLQVGAKTTTLDHTSAFPYLIAAFAMVVAILTMLVVRVVCHWSR